MGWEAGNRLRVSMSGSGRISVKQDETRKSATVLRYRSNAKSFFHVIPKEICEFLNLHDKQWLKLMYHSEKEGLIFSYTGEQFNRLEDRKNTLRVTREIITDTYRTKQVELYRKQAEMYERMKPKH